MQALGNGPAGSLAEGHLRLTEQRLGLVKSVVGRIATDLVTRIRELTVPSTHSSPSWTSAPGPARPTYARSTVSPGVSAAKFVGAVAGIERFRSRHAFARHNGTAPTPVWSGNSERHRPIRAGNRQLNVAVHRIALTQARSNCQARARLKRRQQAGATRKEALRCLKRRLSDVIYRAHAHRRRRRQPCCHQRRGLT